MWLVSRPVNSCNAGMHWHWIRPANTAKLSSTLSLSLPVGRREAIDTSPPVVGVLQSDRSMQSRVAYAFT